MSEVVPQYTPPAVDDDGIADFTIQRKRVRFRVDKDVFEAAQAVPAEVFMELMDLQSQIDQIQADGATQEQRRQFLADFFGRVLLKESLDRFLARLRDKDNPIDLMQMSNIIGWIFAQYSVGLPLGQQPDSSDGSKPSLDGGTRSMEDVSSPASTSGDSPPTDS